MTSWECSRAPSELLGGYQKYPLDTFASFSSDLIEAERALFGRREELCADPDKGPIERSAFLCFPFRAGNVALKYDRSRAPPPSKFLPRPANFRISEEGPSG